ncbi:hypothetical protein CVO96_02375 [Deinococcus koreensis]|uniref:Uncharacterized protein n=2 Tax=Deinococcus koreensis TaxID=2054903 RepID=A0A2K3UV08_9DEIO|nr:hypothetical protein CVO96_02375 [Deinococcus koreensis]
MASFSEGGAIAAVLKKADTDCDSVGIYEYRDGPAATAGLAQWLTLRGLTAREYDRTKETVLWVAKDEEMELIGEWIAPAPQQAGRLEMCFHRLVTEVNTRIPVVLIGWLLAGVGALGGAVGGLYTRLSARRGA